MTKAPFEDFLAYVEKLTVQGVSYPEAFERARLEQSIRSWPKAWGDYLEVWLYGAIEITSDIDIPELGLHVSSVKKTDKFVFSAPWAYRCRLEVKSKDLPGVLDAIDRLETFLNSWHIVSWGRTIHYFCTFFTSGGDAVTELPKEWEGIKRFLSALGRYKQHQCDLILRAAWWLRHSQHSFLSGHYNPSSFAIYSSYWNAFECLVELICDIVPPRTLSRTQKVQNVAKFFQNRRQPTPADVEFCYQTYVNPGLPKRARHALAVVFGPVGEQYYEECFRKQPEQDRLYQIRNDINHANIVEFNLDDRLRVENGLYRLQIIVLNMFFVLTRQSVMLDTEIRACHTCAHLDQARTCKLNLLPADTRYWRYVCDSYTKKENR